MKTKKEFTVSTFASFSDDDLKENGGYSHWSKNLKMIIKKDGISIILNESEINELVKALPRTIGGVY